MPFCSVTLRALLQAPCLCSSRGFHIHKFKPHTRSVSQLTSAATVTANEPEKVEGRLTRQRHCKSNMSLAVGFHSYSFVSLLEAVCSVTQIVTGVPFLFDSRLYGSQSGVGLTDVTADWSCCKLHGHTNQNVWAI